MCGVVALTWSPDVNAVADALTTLLDDGSDDVVVVMHSYGGMVGTDAVGKVVEERSQGGNNTGKIRRLVYVSAYVPLEGHTLGKAMEGAVQEPPPPPEYLSFEAPYIALNDLAVDTFYHDVPEPLVSQYAPLLGKQPAATFATPVGYAGWRRVPSTFVYTTHDRPLPLVYQQFIGRRAQEVANQHGCVRPFEGAMGEVYMDSGHTPFLSRMQEMGDILIRAAEIA
ncbi:hypothetical protein C8A05DRAFT_48207 [Staphylotrichum tortipilum]|uniref:AB hydrolase-1 domain-containing protein n=1 Tax=Staphylotrichum tortipilum TaxID=2831512 RepID=A0AAN6M9G7_9PEZI|nr:hypothetical protein C8A05DRAFT_48207 [Staphylotrichum longicolle]